MPATSVENKAWSATLPRRRHTRITPYLFMLPALLMVVTVSIIPIFEALWMSFARTSFLRVTGFAGLDNYVRLLRSNQIQGDIVRSGIYVFGSLAIVLPFGVLLAFMLNRPMRLRGAFRTIILLPLVISQTIAALIWKWGLNPDFGPFTSVVTILTGRRMDPLSNPAQAMGALIGVNAWLNYPFVVVMTLAALQSVPIELAEAAQVDGANAWQFSVKIVLPLIRPTLLITTIMLTLLFFNMVTLVLTFTAGGPFFATNTLSLEAYDTSFQFFQFSQGAALSVILFIINILLSALYVFVLRGDANE